MQTKLPKQLPWEENVDGSHASLHNGLSPFKTKGANIRVKLIAVAKMTEVGAISADFHGRPVVFEPWVSVLLDYNSSVKFYGAYQRSFASSEGEPNLLLRSSSWEQTADYRQFAQAENKLDYVLSDKQLKIKSLYTNLNGCQEIAALIDEVIGMNLRGLALEDCQRDENKCMELQCEIVSHSSSWSGKFSYHPPRLKNTALEDWVNRWRDCFEKIDSDSGFIPDKGSRISYKMSFAERLEWSSV